MKNRTFYAMLGLAFVAVFSLVSSNPANAQTEGCPTDVFLDVSQYEGAGEAYEAPSLSVSCTNSTLIVQSNGIPHYEFVQITPNPLVAVDVTYEITLDPQLADETTDIPLLGTVGFAINGIPFFGPNEGQFPDPYGDPIYNGIMDSCMGHTAAQYHYHAFVQSCLSPDSAENQPSPILGYALDGFPIYGSYGCVDATCTEIIKFESSWEAIGDPSTYAWDNYQYVAKEGVQYLDQCNGRIGPDGTYRYYATDTFPYIIGCYAGTPNGAGAQAGQNGGQQPPQNGNGPQQNPPQGAQNGEPDLTSAAQRLGITVEQLMAALGDNRPPDLNAAAQTLGISVETLIQALGIPAGGVGNGQPPQGNNGQPPQGPPNGQPPNGGQQPGSPPNNGG